MTPKPHTRKGWFLRATGSIGAKIILILLAIGATSAIAGLNITTAFTRITTNVHELTETRLQTLSLAATVNEAVSQAQKELISLLLASDDEALQAAFAQENAALKAIGGGFSNLGEEEQKEFQTSYLAVHQAMRALAKHRGNEFSSKAEINKQIAALSSATLSAQRELGISAQDAKASMLQSSQQIVAHMDAALASLVAREFAAIQMIMNLRTNLAILAVDTLETETALTLNESEERSLQAASSLAHAQRNFEKILNNTAITANLSATEAALSQWEKVLNTDTVARRSMLQEAERQQIEADKELTGQVDRMMFLLEMAAEQVSGSNMDASERLMGSEISTLLEILNTNNRIALLRSTSLELSTADTSDAAQEIGERIPPLLQTLQANPENVNVGLDEAIVQDMQTLLGTSGLLRSKLLELQSRDGARDASLVAATAMTDIAEITNRFSQTSRDGISDIAAEISADVDNAAERLNLMLIISAVAIILGVFVTYAFILRPLIRLSETTERLAGGDMRPVPSFARKGTEITRIAGALTIFRDGLVEKEEVAERAKAEREARQKQQDRAVASLATGLELLSEGDLTVRVTADLDGSYRKLRDDFNVAVERLEQSVRAVSNSGQTIAGNTTKISTVAQNLSQKSRETSDTLTGTTASLGRLSTSIADTAQASNAVSASVQNAQETATSSIQIVDETIQAMRDLQEGTDKIAQIIDVIDGIAQQTNLLALNAGVEAARAGEFGRGFAVVASEVRQLANQSKSAADEISQLVQESGEQAQLNVDLVQRTGDAMAQISETVSTAADRMAEIAAATETQSSELQSVSHAMTGLDNTTKANDHLFQGVSQSSLNLSDEAQAMQAAINRFRIGAIDHVSREDAQDSAFLNAMP